MISDIYKWLPKKPDLENVNVRIESDDDVLIFSELLDEEMLDASYPEIYLATINEKRYLILTTKDEIHNEENFMFSVATCISKKQEEEIIAKAEAYYDSIGETEPATLDLREFNNANEQYLMLDHGKGFEFKTNLWKVRKNFPESYLNF